MSHEKFKVCIDACNDSAAECEHCATACLNESDAAMQAKCIELDLYCVDMCRMAAAFMARSDEHTIDFVNKFCALCAEICTTCADECGKHIHIKHCIKCAESCRKCSAECHNISTVNNLQTNSLDYFRNKVN
ncbi:four-helix bundle copper-binding protein [Flavobacterium franklandianum]|uniref:Four-helix bundle copper-binding protein n=2 Tax=Flavobacterium franklandianum TaxID=2594430 RepID=A0A553C7N2_9FLAO|nr:four-helix bundle copper-binding protein [Flavobacterium franklandianum]